MAEMTLKNFLKANHKLNAENPVDPNLFADVPFFEEVFSNDFELWEILTKLAGADGISHIEDKRFREGESIIKEGGMDQMVYWMIDGKTEVFAMQNNKRRLVKWFKNGDCFGELAIIKENIRTADVLAGKGGARVLEIDWAITSRCFELDALFTKLMLKTVAAKLEESFGIPGGIIKVTAKYIKERDEQIRELKMENKRLMA